MISKLTDKNKEQLKELALKYNLKYKELEAKELQLVAAADELEKIGHDFEKIRASEKELVQKLKKEHGLTDEEVISMIFQYGKMK